MHKLSAGTGYEYYVSETACADVKETVVTAGQELGDYYTAKGLPPGQWMGHSKELFGVEGEVTREQMGRLFGQGTHPDPSLIPPSLNREYEKNLGRAYDERGQGKSEFTQRVEARAKEVRRRTLGRLAPGRMTQIRAQVGAEMFDEQYHRRPSKEELSTYIRRKENPVSQVVAGYDLTFAPPKSVSVLWALGGEEARLAVEKAQAEAVQETIAYFEENVAMTRSGRGGIEQRKVHLGVAVNGFRHFENRHGEPHLHDHIVISNKVKALVPVGREGNLQERWLALDGRHVYRQMVELSEIYNRKIMDKVTAELDLTTVERSVGRGKTVTELAGIDDHLIDLTSTRRRDIKAKERELVAQYKEAHHRSPGPVQRYKLFQQATLESRPKKEAAKSLEERIVEWDRVYTKRPKNLLKHMRSVAKQIVHESGKKAYDLVEVTAAVMNDLQVRRAVWGKTHIVSTLERYLRTHVDPVSIPHTAREDVLLKATSEHSIRINAQIAPSKAFELNTAEGTNLFAVHRNELYTSRAILDAEHRLLLAAQTQTIPAARREHFDAALLKIAEASAAKNNGQMRLLDAGQQRLAQAFSTSDAAFLVGVGPAGSGKTTAMQAAVEAVHIAGGQVIVLAPSAAAAKVLSRELSENSSAVAGETMHRFINKIDNDKARINAGDMILVDEAGLAGTLQLDKIVDFAQSHGAVVRAIGDPSQLGAVGAGGALRLVKNEVGAVELEEIHRFRNPDEALASLDLRDPSLAPHREAFDWYRENGRILGGDKEHIIQAAHRAWAADQKRFQEHPELRQSTLLVAPDTETVTALNELAQVTIHGTAKETFKETVARLTKGGVKLSDGLTAVPGDLVITRENNRFLTIHNGQDFTKNGDRWTVEATHRDGSLDVVHQEHGARTTLPTDYVREHVQLGYAATIHSAQGITVTTSHAVGVESMTRSAAYVALTRGKESNRLYMVLSEETSLDDGLEAIANRVDDSLSAHELIERAAAEQHNISTLRLQYASVAENAQAARVAHIFENVLGSDADRFINSPAFGAIATNVRKAEELGLDAAGLITRSVNQRDFENSEEDGAILAWRIERNTEHAQALIELNRPLQSVTNEHLAKLYKTAAWRKERAEEYAETPPQLQAHYPDGVKPWHERFAGRFSHEELARRIKATQDEILRIVPSEDPEQLTMRRLRFRLKGYEREQSIRQTLDPETHISEEAHRGIISNWSKNPEENNKAHINRNFQAGTILKRIETEQRIRELLADPNQNEHLIAAALRDAVPEWIAPTHVLARGIATGSLSEPLSAEIMDRRARLEHELIWRGHELAAAPPAWAQHLGPVPSDPTRQAEWKHLAAQIDTYRETYKIPHTEPQPIPADHLNTEHGKLMIGDELAAQVKAIHKYTAMTKKPPASTEELIDQAAQARLERTITTISTPASELVDHYRAERNQLYNLTNTKESPITPTTGPDAPHAGIAPRPAALEPAVAVATQEKTPRRTHELVQSPVLQHHNAEALEHLRDREQQSRDAAQQRREAEQQEARKQRRREKDARQLRKRRAKAQEAAADVPTQLEVPLAEVLPTGEPHTTLSSDQQALRESLHKTTPVEQNQYADQEHRVLSQPEEKTTPQYGEQLELFPAETSVDQTSAERDQRFYQEAEFLLQQGDHPSIENPQEVVDRHGDPSEQKTLRERISQQNYRLKRQRSRTDQSDRVQEPISEQSQALQELNQETERMKQHIEDMAARQQAPEVPELPPLPDEPQRRGPQR